MDLPAKARWKQCRVYPVSSRFSECCWFRLRFVCSRRNRPQFVVCCVYPYLGQLSASPNGWLVGLLYYCGYHICLTLGDPGRFRWNILQDKTQSCTTSSNCRWFNSMKHGKLMQQLHRLLFFVLAHPHVSGSNIAKSRCPNLHGQLHFFQFKHYGSAPPHFG
jgi:hypothetical protein